MSVKGYVLQGQVKARRGVTLNELLMGVGYPMECEFTPVSEAEICTQFVTKLRQATLDKKLKCVWFHIPNEGKRTWGNGKKMKQQGLIAGMPDYAFLGLNFSGVIEFKYGKNKLSPPQETVRDWLSKYGVHYALCTSSNEALEVLKKWGVLV